MKKIIIEHRYKEGGITIFLPSLRNWMKYSSYEKLSSAEEALKAIRQRHGGRIEFRIRDDNASVKCDAGEPIK